jgi:hypothetical protein
MNSSNSHDDLRETLRSWNVEPTSNPNFRPEVWARIRQQQRASWSGYVRAHAGTLAVAACVTLIASGWAGNAASQAQLDAAREKMVVSYLVELDPRVQANLREAP